MRLLALNMALTLGWSALVGSFTLPSLIVGFVLAYCAIWVARPLFGETTYFERGWRLASLSALFVYELIVSSLRVVWDVVTPSHLSSPWIIAMPLDAESDTEILVVANLISLTPGTLSLDISEDRKTLYVHCMFVEDPDALREELKQGMERKVLEALR